MLGAERRATARGGMRGLGFQRKVAKERKGRKGAGLELEDRGIARQHETLSGRGVSGI
jgi:hypothetical protein